MSQNQMNYGNDSRDVRAVTSSHSLGDVVGSWLPRDVTQKGGDERNDVRGADVEDDGNDGCDITTGL
jgi:hypothetical protein